MSTPIPENVRVGSRIQVSKDRGTVKFCGKVGETKGEWLGIEWDDPSRGKHDGTHQGTCYFTCRYPTSGSFIRFHPEKVQLGISFLKALHEKYLEEDTLTKVRDQTYDKSKDRGELYFGGNKQIVVETYGFEKIQRSQRQLSSLKVVGLAEQTISYAGNEPDEISKAKLTTEDLDLSRNLIHKWQTVSDIVSQLPHLSILRINQLRFSGSPPAHGLQLSNLKVLSLNKVWISWKDIELLAPSIPLLEDLQLGSNQISELGSNLNLQHLKWLNLEDNLICDWNEVAKLGSLPNLETLYLNDNQLTKIEKPSTNEMFAELRYLRIENNAIGDWDSLNALNCFGNLTKLRCKQNPIFIGLEKEVEVAQIVGRIKSLTNVNGNTLSSRERTDLERYYIKWCTRDGTTHEAIASIHPRYAELCTKHGEPDLQVQIKEKSTALKDRLINVTLTIRDTASLTEEALLSLKFKKELPGITKSISKKFLRTMTIRNVRHMIQRLLKIPAARQHLFLLQSIAMENAEERDLIVMDITDDLRDLKFYAINDGDEILVIQM